MLPSTVAYRCMKPMTIGGQQLSAGALLPMDSPVRQDARRLEILYRTRRIEPAEGTQVASKQSQESLLVNLTSEELKLLCKNRGLATKGTEDALRARLTTVLGQ